MWQYPTDENAPPRGGLTEYELAREANIARNRAEFQARGLHDLAAALRPPVAGAAGAGQERCGARAGGGGPGVQRPKAAAAPSTRAEPYPLRHARPHKEVSKKAPKSKQQRFGQGAARAAQETEQRRRRRQAATQWRVGGNDDDGYGAAERVCETDDEGGGGRGGPAGTVTLAADLAARYQQDAEEAAAAEEAQRRRHAASGAAYFNSHGRQHGSHALLAELPLADEYTIQALLQELPAGHTEERSTLRAQFQSRLFPRWRALLEAGFNICAYGWGSKKELLDSFVMADLNVEPTSPISPGRTECFLPAPSWAPGAAVVMNGYHPDASAKHLLASCAMAVSSQPLGPNWLRGRTVHDLLRDVETSTRAGTQHSLFVVIHNIDGPALRSTETQTAIASLASLPGVHLLASADNVNFPLLWSKRLASRLRWVWEHVSTYEPYTCEVQTVPRVLSGRGEERLVRGAASVLLSLTPNARAVFRLLAEAQLRGNESCGLSFAQWYAACRQQFSVASEGALHLHLGEFLDHNLVKRVKRPDGTDALHIQFTTDDLQQILEDIGAG